MKKSEIKEFYEKFGISESNDMDNEYPKIRDLPPIPIDKRLVFRCY